MPNTLTLAPQSGPQEAFHASPADIVIFGGGAGGGKTWSVIVEPLRHAHVPNFRATIFRRTYPQITMDGGLWDEAQPIYEAAGAQVNRSFYRFTFNSTATVTFSHLQYEHTVRRYDGAQIALLIFDQLEEFSEKQFWYMISRNRSTSGVAPYVRATVNPEPDSWIARFIDWWIGPDGYIIPERSGVIRWFVRLSKEEAGLDENEDDDEDRLVWANDPQTLLWRYPHLRPKSFTFILSRLFDNKILLEKNPHYLGNLLVQHSIERARLLGEGIGDENKGGNWHTRAGRGTLFRLNWFPTASYIPPYHDRVDVLFWDTAATERDLKTRDDQAATAYMHMCAWIQPGDDLVDDTIRYCIMEIGELFEYATVHNTMAEISERISREIGNQLHVRWEQEPGSAARRESHTIKTLLEPFCRSAEPHIERQDKIKRAMPAATAAQNGHIALLEADWNDYLRKYLHNQPSKPMDLLDCLSGCKLYAKRLLPMTSAAQYHDRRGSSAAQTRTRRNRRR